MSLATHLAGRLARIALVAPALARLKRNAVRAVLGIGLMLVLGGLGLTYLLIALRYQLEREIGPLWTPLAIGGALALAALVAYLALLRPRRARTAAADAPALGIPPEIAASMHHIQSKVARNPLPSIGIALLVGFAAASLLRILRRRDAAQPPQAPAWGPGPASPYPGRPEQPPWMREVLLRETDRRKANGRGA